MIKKLRFLAVAFLITIATVMQAQVTTSSMSGRVTDVDGAVIGATVVATHVPSGTTYGTVTNIEGRYNLNGMRVGGPYTVEVSYIGYGNNITDGITLSLGENYAHNVVMQEETVALGEVVVTALRTKFSSEKTGASTNINNEQMSRMPSVNRSITDITRLSPYASGMSIAAGDGRSTNFTIDGANFNNNFGLSSSLPGGGNPISLDAIEEMQVVVAPFDVRQTNFIGGGVNAITKSGTNKFKGTAYTYLYNQDLRGNKIGDVDFGDRAEESKNVYGFTLGGPIVKNKLFFFVNAELENRPGQVVTWRPSQNGQANPEQQLSRTSIADMDRVKQHLIDKYGYNPGSYTDFPGDESNRKILARIDWNINNKHRLSLRYNHTKNQAWNPTNGNSTDAGYRNRNMNRISQYGMAFSNNIYSMDNIVNTISGELNSRFSDRLSNQLLVTSSEIKDMRGSNSDKFPHVDILAGRDANGVPIIEPYISLGYELFTWNNGVNNNTMTITDNLTYYLDNHKITAGLSYEYQMANNAYMRNGTGYYRYASVDDFINQAAPIDFALTYGYDGEQDPAAEVAFHQIGAYLQDEYSVTENAKVTLGLRADYLRYADNIIRNNAIYNLDFAGRRIDTGTWPEAKVQLSPRVGFTWDVRGDKTLNLRGGLGVFTGRLPLVFFTNMPTNSGMVQGSAAFVTKYNSQLNAITSQDPKLAQLAGPIMTDVNEMISRLGLPNTISPDQGALPRDINGVDPNFKMPQVWKYSLAADYQLPTSFPMAVTVEGIFTKTINGVMLKNYNLKQPDASWQRFSGPDNRYIYPASKSISNTSTNTAAYVLSNTNEGWGAIGNVTVTAEPVRNLNLMAAYTITESREITGMPGSNAASAYGGLISINGPHLPSLERSQYVGFHKVIGSASYTLPYANDHLATHLNIFYLGSPSGNYSFIYDNDMNGDGWGADLIYIPEQKGDIKFVSQADEDAFFAFMDQDSYLKNHKGGYAGANSVMAPWLHRFDLRFAQDFKIRAGETTNTLQVSLDVLNFGNLLNSKWGVPKNDMSVSNNGAILSYEGNVPGTNTPTFSFATDKDGEYIKETFTTDYWYGHTWRLQIGLRYIFN
ncbi:MAG: carboxypeptidase regulatory-like domain-containing protein [Fermentimonas sp.]|nr:carboxypeptidase regulatory-like domain-containing protein [Fermentimonas sp.]